MKTYTIKWEVQVDANNPLEAAQQALDMQRDKDSDANVFDVSDFETGKHLEQVDLHSYNQKKEWLKNARHYLCDLETDEEVEYAVKAIAAHHDQTEYIDWVEDEKVIVWEKVANSLTCDEFLEEIGYFED